MASLLARLAPGRRIPGRRIPGFRIPGLRLGHPGWLAAAAAVAVSVLGLTGLTLAVVVVQTLDPTGGLPFAGSTALAGRLWLLAQGGTLRLEHGPIALAPLLLTLALAWGLSRAGRGVVRFRAVTGRRAVAEVLGVLAGVHLLLTLLVAVVVDTPDVGAGLVRATLGAAVLALLGAGWGVGRESGLLDALLARAPGPARPMLRGVAAGLLTALALCTAVVAIAVAAGAGGYARMSAGLGGSAAGAVGLLALALLVLPNAAAAVLGLAAGPGFVVGTTTLVSVHGVTLGALPALPLLAALPDTQAVPLIAWVSQAVPAVAGLVAGRTLGRHLGDDDTGSVVAGLWGLLAGLLMGAGAAAITWVGGGALGDGALAEVGAPPLATGLAVALQAGIAAAVAAAVARWRARS